MRLAAIALVLAASACAQVTAPLLGWLPQGSAIRPMNGLAGAAVLGPPVNVGHRLANIAVSPSQDYVLASDAGSGAVLLIVPGTSAIPLAVPSNPDRIVVSPRGSSAAEWYPAAGQLEIVSGLPGSPVVRQLSLSIAPPGALAVSDDGQWVAAASAEGVEEWSPDGAMHQVYEGSDAEALTFFGGNSNLAIATATGLLSASASGSAMLYPGSFSAAGLGISFDNRKIVLADRDGTIYSIDAASHAAAVLDCQCTPGGVFSLGGAVFRLTSSDIGPVKLVDAVSGAILEVPRAGRESRSIVHPQQSGQPLPALAINLSPTSTGYLQQPAMTITVASAYPDEIDGNVTLTFASFESGTDNSIQFSNASNTVNFTIPAGSTQANFSGAPNITFSTGSIAGTITLVANVTAPQTANSVATQAITNQPTVPFISSVTLNQTPGGVTVVITGYSSAENVESGTFNFSLSSNASITTNDITVSVSPQFQAYYSNSSSYATGSEFTLSVPFAITGNPNDLTGVTVTLLNIRGASNPVSSQ